MKGKIPIILLLMLTLAAFSGSSLSLAASPTASDLAANYLKTHEFSNGTFGAYREHWAASAAYALCLYEGNSTTVNTTLGTLKTAIEDQNAWFWDPTYGEADIPGLILYAFAASHHLNELNLTRVIPLEEGFRNSTSGGYRGYYGVAYDAVNTAYALLGLKSANEISQGYLMQSVDYLLALQTQSGASGGSFNMTNTISSSSFQALSPDSISQTAAVLLALKAAGATTSNSSIGLALNYLQKASLASGTSLPFQNQTFATALSAIAFEAFNDVVYAQIARFYLASLQNQDGGFSDKSRSSYPTSNGLDTAWALIALQSVPPSSASLSLTPSSDLIIAVATIVFVALSERRNSFRKIETVSSG